MLIEERHQKILDWLEEKGYISTDDIQEEFQVSYDSAKRDLRILEEKELLKRTRGGALPLRQVGIGRPKGNTARDIPAVKENYALIAKKAVSMLRSQDVIYITSGTVGYFMAQNISDEMILRVCTNSIVVAEELRRKANVSVILIGGEMDDKGCCYDGFATEMIRKLRFDKCFLTSASISAEFGISMQRTAALSFYEALIKGSKQVIGLYPKEKIGFHSVVSIAPAESLDLMITDWDASEEDLKLFSEKGIRVEIVEKPARTDA